MEFTRTQLKDLLDLFLAAQKVNSSTEYESAPSGEFAEYNVGKLQLEATEDAFCDAIYALGLTPKKLYNMIYG